MGTKIETIQGAYSQMRISGLTVNPTPEDEELALVRFENMMAELEGGRTLCVGYNFEQVPLATSETGVERVHEQMMETNLAIRLTPDFNKQIPDTLRRLAASSYQTSSNVVARDRIRSVPNSSRMGRGSGNVRYSRWRHFYPLALPMRTDCKNTTLFRSDTADLVEDFSAYLGGETIASFVITATGGVALVDDVSVLGETGFDTACGVDWTCGGTASIAASAGTLVADADSFTQTTDGIIAGKHYDVVINPSNVGGGTIIVTLGNGAGINVDTTGAQTIDIIAGGGQDLVLTSDGAAGAVIDSCDIVESPSTDSIVAFRVLGQSNSNDPTSGKVQITVTTNTGRIETRVRDFEVVERPIIV